MADKPIRALVIGAHPDDCEFRAGGLTVKYLAQGHVVKYVSVTNGESGHHQMMGRPLAERRRAETERVSELFGMEYEVLAFPDGRLIADIAVREQVIGLIRRFQPDLIFTHRTNDYHPDHRHTGILVQDSSYLVRVPHICPDVPPLAYSPIILYLEDPFEKPNALTADVVVAIDDVFEQKVKMLGCHESQVYEWLPHVEGYAGEVPKSERLAWFTQRQKLRDGAVTDRYRDSLAKRYGAARAKEIGCAEVFEVSEYGRPLPEGEVDRWFPR